MQRKDAYLEIGLHWRGQENGVGSFDVNLDLDDPADSGDRRDYGDAPVELDVKEFTQLVGDEAAYGQRLRESLFAGEKTRDFYRRALALNVPVHLRLLIDPRAPSQYHSLRWESLRDPEHGDRIAVTDNVLFSRFLNSESWGIVSPPPRHDLRALVVIANPSDLNRYGLDSELAPIDVEAELERARAALAHVERVELASQGSSTIDRVLSELAHDADEPPIDVLYLVCHGETDANGSVLFLEDASGAAAPVRDDRLIGQLRGINHRPTLAVLASCSSAGAGDEDLLADGEAQAALGPELARIGVPAVVAMQGQITIASINRFLPKFFEELDGDGTVDRAMAKARAAIENRPDWWVPVLFSRLKRGRTYYEPEFGKRRDAWQGLLDRIAPDECTPVVGPGMAESLIGSRKQIARKWAQRWQMPLVNSNGADLATVAQYLRVRMAADQPALELRRYLIALMRDKYKKEREAGLLDEQLFRDNNADELLRKVGGLRRGAEEVEPYRVAAALRASVYVTTNWTDLLEDAITDAGGKPVSHYFDWTSETDDACTLSGTRDAPLVYHMFGQLSRPSSLVLSQDDYFAWLRAWIHKSNTSVLPSDVRDALTCKGLLFLGYELDDWDFRVLFQGIKTFRGNADMRGRFHVGVQLNPELQTIEPESAQEYLESYFGADNVTIYWGRLNDFLKQLKQKLPTP